MVICVSILVIFVVVVFSICYIMWRNNKKIINELKQVKEIKEQEIKQTLLLSYSYIYNTKLNLKKEMNYETC